MRRKIRTISSLLQPTITGAGLIGTKLPSRLNLPARPRFDWSQGGGLAGSIAEIAATWLDILIEGEEVG